MLIELVRFLKDKNRTLGRFSHDGETYYTVERPWLDNIPFKSCIPDGEYTVERVNSPRFGDDMWSVVDVPNRTHILLHVGNTERDVVGCLAVGDSLLGTLFGVRNSKIAIDKFYDATDDLDSFQLTIRTGSLG